MNRIVIFVILGLAMVVFGVAIATNDLRNASTQTAQAPTTTPDLDAEGAASRTEIMRSDTGAASNMATDAAVAALEETGRPVQGAIDEVREITEAFGTVGAEAGETAQNDEAALGAPRVDAEMATDPAFVSDALSGEGFNAELVVALIDASPHLSVEQKTDLRVAVQVVAQDPETRSDVLDRLESILLIAQ